MGILIVSDVSKHYGAQEVLRAATLQIEPGEKLGLVGRNGGGKSTLLRLIEGLERPDSGSITLRKGARLGHVPQSPEFAAGESVRDYVSAGMAEARRALAASERLAEQMAHQSGAELARSIAEHEAESERARRLGAWEIDRRVETVLSGIGIPSGLWEREARTLSGGERGRVALARELVGGHDLLLLDEPTNHLDLAGIEWLETWLEGLASAVLLVSHDRRLLDNAVDAIVELERGSLRRYPGHYAKYVALREERYTSELRAWENQQEVIRKEEDFIRRNLGSQRTAEAKGRQKKLENLTRLERPFQDVRRPHIPPPKAERGGELVIDARGLSGGYGQRLLFQGLDLRIGRGQRLGIVGPNGAGKSTLLRILAGRAQAVAGELEHGHKALCGYYDQDTSDLNEEATPYVELRRRHPQLSDQDLRAHLARFLFRGDEVDKSVAALSGGERARLALAILTLQPITWLAMDEPTNHLDLAARTALEEFLGTFDGALVCVSHDRAFLDALCTQLVIVRDGAATVFSGRYSEWRQSEREALARREAESSPRKSAPGASDRTVPEPRPKTDPGKIRNPWAFERLEARIMELEEELARLQAAMTTEAVYRDAAKLRESQTRIAEIEVELADANERWANWD